MGRVGFMRRICPICMRVCRVARIPGPDRLDLAERGPINEATHIDAYANDVLILIDQELRTEPAKGSALDGIRAGARPLEPRADATVPGVVASPVHLQRMGAGFGVVVVEVKERQVTFCAYGFVAVLLEHCRDALGQRLIDFELHFEWLAVLHGVDSVFAGRHPLDGIRQRVATG